MISIFNSHPWLYQINEDKKEKILCLLNTYGLTEQQFVEWFSNFRDEEQYKLALKVFFLIDFRPSSRSIETIKLYKTQIEQSLYELSKSTIILISDDDIVDSSNHFIYPLAKEWKIDKSNIFRKSDLSDEIKNNPDNFFIFFNDTHGTGNQFITEFKNIITQIGEQNCGIISITMTSIALERFKTELPNLSLIQPTFQSTKNIDMFIDEGKFSSLDKELLKQMGEKVYSKGVLGYKDSALLIAYSHQCPNNTLPIIWANGENNEIDGKAYPWKPLFEYKKIKSSKQSTKKFDERNLTTLPPVNPDFIGRVDELETIKKNLEDDNLIYIVNGIGGVGKSELAYEYFHQHKNDYKKIAFIELSGEDSSLEDIFLIKFHELFQVDSFEKIIKRLQEYPKKNLLLVDNLEKREDFEKLKVLNSNFDLLLTSRLTDIDTKHQLNLETLPKEDAKKLFLSIYKTDENIEDILIYLDNHPLFINLMAKSLVRRYITLDELRDDIENNTLSQIKSTDAKSFQEHLEKLFNRQFEDEKDSDLKELLQILSIFPSIEIDFEVYSKLLGVKKVDLQLLVDKGWLIQKEDQYKLHQIIRNFLFTSHKPPYEKVINIFDRLANYIDPYDSTLIVSQLSYYIPIVESFLHLFEFKQDKYIAGLLDSLTYLYFSLADYDLSLNIQYKSLNIKEKILDKDDPYIAKSDHLLGVIFKSKGKYEDALEWYEKASKIKEEVLGTNHPATATTYNNIASVYYLKGKYEDALEWFEKALKICEEVLGVNHPDTAAIYNNIASVYDSKGKYDDALEWYEKALKIYEEVLGINHPDTAAIYNNIASVYKSKGKYEDALEWYEKALKIKEEVLGVNHPDTSKTYNNIASVYDSKGKYEDALDWYEKALKICEEVLGINHPDTATTYNNMAYVYKSKKLCIKALEFFRKALKIYQETDYNQHNIFNINREIKAIEKLQKKEKKVKFKDKGRFCKEDDNLS